MPTHGRDHPSASDSGRLDWSLFDPTVHNFSRPVLLSALRLFIFHVSALFFYPWSLAAAPAGGAAPVPPGGPGTAPAPAGVGLPGGFAVGAPAPLLLRNLVIIDFAAAREGPFLWSKTPVFDTVLGTWSLVLQAPGCIPAVWISLSSVTSTGSGSRHCCLGHLGFSDSRCPLHSRSCVLWPSRHMIWHWHLAFAVLGT